MATAACAVQIVLQTIVIILSSLIVVRVTTRAGRLVARRGPVDDFRVRAVAFGAIEIAAMIEGLVRESAMTEIGRCPGVWRMTNATILSRAEMPGILAGGVGAVVA